MTNPVQDAIQAAEEALEVAKQEADKAEQAPQVALSPESPAISLKDNSTLASVVTREEFYAVVAYLNALNERIEDFNRRSSQRL